ncbi:DUF397 domain-containing protein [Streptomyces avicenniae]|uniref:DUF397 domain-containing protein n=1 Tax=Streptomyces avicenniae TaxID=500153 RepID=UPI000B1D9790|nr:DUF397 domain-containing protein [Streptomyces avicenniae]
MLDSTSLLSWRKSSYSNPDGGQCVEVGVGRTALVPVRDSKAPADSVLLVPSGGWSSFVSAVKNGVLDA